MVEDQHPRRFPAVPPEPNFRALEEQALEHWEAHDVFSRSISEHHDGPEYVFFEGPPTANGRPGLHHVWARVYKDLICRYRTMTGRRVPSPGGLGHARPGGRGGSGKGTRACRARTRSRSTASSGSWTGAGGRSTSTWTTGKRSPGGSGTGSTSSTPTGPSTLPTSTRSGGTCLQLWESGDLFEDLKVVPYCPRCGTSLSSHELGQPDVYQDVEDLSCLRPAAGRRRSPRGRRRPGHLDDDPVDPRGQHRGGGPSRPRLRGRRRPGNGRGQGGGGAWAGGRDRITARFPGERLVGLHYRRPIDLLPEPKGSDGWRVVPAGFVSAAEGSGLVHIAPAFGLDDWLLGRREGLPTLNPVGPDGRFVDAGWLSGLSVRQANQPIVEYLADAGQLVKAEAHVHSYPHCWRCGTALIYWGKPSWYVATSRHKDQLLAENEGVTWRPGTLKHGRFGEWLANNIDWALSRDRYWGTPLPIWRCPNGHDICVASRAHLSELAARDLTEIDPHRPVIDEVSFDCPQCHQTARRVEAVIDAWFDSGSMPAAQLGYPFRAGSKKDLRLPADFICEAVDQTRGWFYSLLAVNTLVFGRAPYRTVMSLGHIVDSEGKKMSKSLGNVIDPWAILDTRGAEPMRWWMFHQGSPWTATRTSLEAIDASTSEVLMTLWNTWSFFATYAELNHFDPTDPAVPAPRDRPTFDRWLRSRLEVDGGGGDGRSRRLPTPPGSQSHRCPGR